MRCEDSQDPIPQSLGIFCFCKYNNVRVLIGKLSYHLEDYNVTNQQAAPTDSNKRKLQCLFLHLEWVCVVLDLDAFVEGEFLYSFFESRHQS